MAEDFGDKSGFLADVCEQGPLVVGGFVCFMFPASSSRVDFSSNAVPHSRRKNGSNYC
jgi:hypothetical protein